MHEAAAYRISNPTRVSHLCGQDEHKMKEVCGSEKMILVGAKVPLVHGTVPISTCLPLFRFSYFLSEPSVLTPKHPSPPYHEGTRPIIAIMQNLSRTYPWRLILIPVTLSQDIMRTLVPIVILSDQLHETVQFGGIFMATLPKFPSILVQI